MHFASLVSLKEAWFIVNENKTIKQWHMKRRRKRDARGGGTMVVKEINICKFPE